MQESRPIINIKFVLPVFIILFVSAVIVLIFQFTRVNDDIQDALIGSIADHIQMTLKVYPKPIVENLAAARELGRSEMFNIKNISELNWHFTPILEQYSHISAVHIADSIGREYLLYNEEGAWMTVEGDAEKRPNRLYYKKWDKNLKRVEEWHENVDYDPRNRPWFKGVMAFKGKDGEAYWTPPHYFFGTRIPVVSAAVKWESESDKTVYVVAFDILLKEMLALKERLHVTETAKIFIVNADSRVTDLSLKSFLAEADGDLQDVSRGKSGQADLKKHRKLLNLALEQLHSGGKNNKNAFVIRENGMRWRGGFRSLQVSGEELQVGVLVPEAELMPDTRKRQRLIIFIACSVLMIGVVLTVLIYRGMAKKYREQLFPRRSFYQTESALLSLIEKGESEELEFKSTMRWNLKTDKAGKEIELAWLKTIAAYMNSRGGLLLIGVADDGEITGLEADNFQNDDKCLLHFNNLIKQHIGLDYSKFLRFEIKEIDERKIFVAECESADVPVFLKNNKGEEFYIRSGPSSIRLTMSEMLNYLHQKGTAS
jgi:hypothetical protein